jgi:microcystin-dependent protein
VTYASLYQVIAYTYGQNGTNFRVPNLKSKFPIGSDTTGTMAVNGVTTGGNLGITIGNMPSHTHTADATGLVTDVTTTSTNVSTIALTGTNQNRITSVNPSYSAGIITSGSTGSGFNYYQPYTAVNFIIKY